MFRTDKSIRMESRLVVAKTRCQKKQRVSTNGQEVSIWGDKKVLKLDNNVSYKKTGKALFTLKTTVFWYL